jgi:hypothetical protein
MIDSKLCILVVGMHRSGTSAVTRVVNLLGAGIARDLTPPQADNNERGFWESEAIIAIHDELLAALGAAWDYPFQLPKNWLQSNFAREAKRKLAERIGNDFADSRTLVVKDPRIARLLPLWLELLDELQIEPLLVIPFRNPLEVVDSLEKRQAFSPQKSLLLYLWSYLDTEAASRGRPRLFIGYDSLLADWRSFAARIQALSGGRLSTAENASNDIEAFLTTDLHHNRRHDRALARRLGKRSPVLEVFNGMRELENIGERPAVFLSFDRLHTSVASVADLFAGLVPRDFVESARIVNELAAVRHALAESEEKRSAQAAELIQAWARIDDLGKLYTAQTDELILTRDHVLRLEKVNAEQQDEMALRLNRIFELEKFAGETQALARSQTAELIEARARIGELEKLYTAQTDELILVRDHVLRLEKINAEQQDQIALRHVRIDELEKLYTAQTDELVLTRGHVLHLEKVNADLERFVTETRVELAVARSRNTELALIDADRRRELALRHARATELEGALTLLRTELSDSRNRGDSQAAELLVLKSSTIWQMTRPLRQFIEAYRRLFGSANRG